MSGHGEDTARAGAMADGNFLQNTETGDQFTWLYWERGRGGDLASVRQKPGL